MLGGLGGWLNQFYQRQMPSGAPHGGGHPMQPMQGPDHMTPQLGLPPMQTGGPGQMQPMMGTGGPGQVHGLTANTGGINPPQQLPQMNTGGPGQVQGQHFGGLAGMFNRQQRGGGLRHMFGFGPDAS